MGSCLRMCNTLGGSEPCSSFHVICETHADAKEAVEHEAYSRTYHSWMDALHLKLTNELL